MKKSNEMDLAEEFDYEIDEIEEEFGGDVSRMMSKKVKNFASKKNKDKQIKFHKDGHFDR